MGGEKSRSSPGRGSRDPAGRKTWLGFGRAGEKRPRGGARGPSRDPAALPPPRSARTREAGSLGLPVPMRLYCHGEPWGALHPGEGPAHCLPSQNVCPPWEFISYANNFFFFSN